MHDEWRLLTPHALLIEASGEADRECIIDKFY